MILKAEIWYQSNMFVWSLVVKWKGVKAYRILGIIKRNLLSVCHKNVL